jgi:transposase-like protein
MHATPQMITSALQLYFTGKSFRNVQKFFKLQGVKITHVAVYKWIKKYVKLMETYLARITSNVSNIRTNIKTEYGFVVKVAQVVNRIQNTLIHAEL